MVRPRFVAAQHTNFATPLCTSTTYIASCEICTTVSRRERINAALVYMRFRGALIKALLALVPGTAHDLHEYWMRGWCVD